MSEARIQAIDGVTVLPRVGSGVHGTSISGQDDREEKGWCRLALAGTRYWGTSG